MQSLEELIEARKTAKAAAKDIEALATREGRSLTDDEKTTFKEHLADIKSLTDQIRSRREDMALTAELDEFDKQIKEERHHSGIEPVGGRFSEDGKPLDDRVYPRSGPLKVFTGPGGARQAFRFGRWFQAVLFNDDGARHWCLKQGLEFRAQSEGKDSKGGVTVPIEFANFIVDLRERYGVFRRYANVQPMMSDAKTVPRSKQGIEAYWETEAQGLTESDENWDNVELRARKLRAGTRMSSELDEDSAIDFAEYIAMKAGEALARKEDKSGFVGAGGKADGHVTGVFTLLGLPEFAGSQVQSDVSTFKTITDGELEDMIGTLPDYADDGAAWYTSRLGWASCFQRLIREGGGNTVGTLAAAAPKEYAGYPVRISQVRVSPPAMSCWHSAT